VRLLAYVNGSVNQRGSYRMSIWRRKTRYALHDRDKKFCASFRSALAAAETDHAPGQESESERVCRALGSAPHEYFGTMGTSRPRDMWAHLSGSDQFRIRSGRTVDGRDGAHP